MGVLFPKVRYVWSGVTGVVWFGLSILVHFGLGGCGEALGFSEVLHGVKESRGGVKFGLGSRVNGSRLFTSWLRFFE